MQSSLPSSAWMLWAWKHFDTSGKSAAQFHLRASPGVVDCVVGWAKAHLRRAHHSISHWQRWWARREGRAFAHPTIAEAHHRHYEEQRDEAIHTPSIRDGALAPDLRCANWHIGESRDSGFDALHRPGMTWWG